MHKTFNQKKHDTKENWMTKAEKYYKIDIKKFTIFFNLEHISMIIFLNICRSVIF